MTPTTFIKTATAILCALGCVAVQAQTAPDAGRLLQEQIRPPALPRPTPGISIQSPAIQVIPSGGAQVALQSVNFTGNTRFSAVQLQAVLADSIGKSFDLAGLRDLTNRVSEYYRAAGYAFASAYLPPQPMQDGALQIAIIEGQYGQNKAQSSDAQLANAAQAFLAPLKSGSVIESSPLERLSLIMDGFPGIKVTPILRPGEEVGTGDLILQVERTDRFTGDLGLDNQGNRYTGANRSRFNLDVNSPFVLGDQITVRSMLTDQVMWMGTLGYGIPLGTSGLRGTASYSRTYYELGGSFAANQASGTADVSSLGISYPLMRSQRANLSLSGNLQDKKLSDKNGLANTTANKTSTTLPVSVSFDARDTVGGGGVTYGAVSWTSGQLNLGSTLESTDLQAQTSGRFNKFNLDLARIQYINSNWAIFGRVSAQQAGKNLDSSEDFGLGGANGVRAYPSGEGFGDQGWLTQLEVRYAMGPYAPYAFYDAGTVTINVTPWANAGTNERSLAGAGFGLRFQRAQWSADAAVAWRLRGGLPQADTQDQRIDGPQIWMNFGYKF